MKIVGADPEGSVYSGGTGRPYLVEGVGEDFWPRAYDPSVVDEVIACTDDTDINIGIYNDAEERAMLVNIVDVPPLCNFILPAIVRTGPLAIAISTHGYEARSFTGSQAGVITTGSHGKARIIDVTPGRLRSALTEASAGPAAPTTTAPEEDSA